MPRLRRSTPDGPGYRRQRRGRGWQYFDADGEPLTDAETKARLKALVIPPAWRDVWICPHDNGHLQATGVDDAGRRQYLYHDQWRREKDEEKHERVLDLVPKLADFRAAVGEALAGKGLTCERVLAGALRMLDRGVFRTGGDEYAEENGSRGVATLLRDDVTVRNGELVFHFVAKGGVDRSVRLADPGLARLVRALRQARPAGARLLAWRADGEWHEVHADAVNERFKELTGPEFTVKDLRTWHATVTAAVAFAEESRPASARAVNRVMDEVAERLGNTRAVVRRSYVDPRVVTAFEEGRTIDAGREDVEQAVCRLLAEDVSPARERGTAPHDRKGE